MQWFVTMEAIFVPELALQDDAGQKILQMERLLGFQKHLVDHESIVDSVVKQLLDGSSSFSRKDVENVQARYGRLLELAKNRVGKRGEGETETETDTQTDRD